MFWAIRIYVLIFSLFSDFQRRDKQACKTKIKELFSQYAMNFDVLIFVSFDMKTNPNPIFLFHYYDVNYCSAKSH